MSNYDSHMVTDSPISKSISPGLDSVVEEVQPSRNVFKRLFSKKPQPDFDYSSVRHKASAHVNHPKQAERMLTNTPSNRLSPRIAPLSYQIKKSHNVSRSSRKSSKASSSRFDIPQVVEPGHDHIKTTQSAGYETVIRKYSEVDLAAQQDVLKQVESVSLSQQLTSPKLTIPTVYGSMAEKYLAQHRFSSQFNSKYAIQDILGEGGFGFVVSALPKDSDREVAVKFILKEKVPIGAYTHDPELQTSLPFELFILRRISHPHIIKLLEWFEDSTFYYVVTELHGSEWVYGEDKYYKITHAFDGRSSKRSSMDLFECIDVHKRFSESLAKMVFRQVVSAIAYLHNNIGMVHRDIKDENLVIDKDYQVKLIDFGASAFIPNSESGRLFTTFHGTPQYCAPEIIKGERYRGPEAEMWGLGVLLYTMLFGENPFNDPKNAMDQRMDVRGLAMGCGLAVHIDGVCICDPKRRNSHRGSVPMELQPVQSDPNSVYLTSQCVDFVDQLLQRNPNQRMRVEQAEVHPWLKE